LPPEHELEDDPGDVSVRGDAGFSTLGGWRFHEHATEHEHLQNETGRWSHAPQRCFLLFGWLGAAATT